MSLIALADLHVSPENEERVRAVARAVCRADAEALIIAGDLLAGPVRRHREILELFADFRGARLFVPGNHDLWQKPGLVDSWKRYHETLPKAVRAAGFHYLDEGPLVVGRRAFIGVMGWYDYSLRQRESPVPGLRVSPAQVNGPRSPWRPLPGRENLVWEQLTPDDYRWQALRWQEASVAQGLMWNDHLATHWDRSDEEMTAYFVQRLRQQAAAVSGRGYELVAVTHFVPFAQLLPPLLTVPGAYARAFAGSEAIGEVLAGLPDLRLVICGHWHHRGLWQLDRLQAANVSTDHARLGPLVLD